MKKIMPLVCCLSGYILISGLTACSYHGVQTEATSSQLSASIEQQNAKSDAEEVQSESLPADQTETSESNASDAEELDRKPDAQKRASSQSGMDTVEGSNKPEQSLLLDQGAAAQQVPVENDNNKPDQPFEMSGFKRMPEELDDGSEGNLSDAAETPLVSDQEKPGNSNINREGRDTYLMEDGKPRRFWNLQRQL